MPELEGASLSDTERRFDRSRRRIGLWLGPLFCVAAFVAASGLEPKSQRLAAVMALVVAYWITEPIPLAVTALLGPALAVVLGVAREREALAPFADPVIFLFLGSFLLAEALRVHGLDRRLALFILSLPGASTAPGRVRLAVAVVTAFVSMWISNTATAAMMLPIALGLVRALASAGSLESPRGTLLVVGIAASLGGIATPVGTPPNLIALGFLDQAGGRLDFVRFMAIGVPLSLALVGLMLVIVRVVLPSAGGAADVASWVGRERATLGPWSSGERGCATAFAVAVVLWLLPGLITLAGLPEAALLRRASERLTEAVVSLLAAGLLFLWPAGGRRALTWREAERIDWGTLLLFGGGLSLGRMMFDTGLARVLGQAAVEATGVETLWSLTALALAVTIALTELASNTATVSMLAPIVIALAQQLGVPVTPPLLAVAFGASMGFMFPVGTPPNAIVYGTGLVPLTAMIRTGVIVDLLSFFVILAGLRLLCPLLGLA